MNKKFKKVLVVLLSALMVLTYFPATVFAAAQYRVVSPAANSIEVVWTGEVPDLSEELAEITVETTTRPTTQVTLKLGQDYTVEANTANVGTAQAIFTCINNYKDCTIQNLSFRIVEPPSTDEYEVTLDTSKFVYDGDVLDAQEVLDSNAAKVIMNGKTRIRLTAADITVTRPTGATGAAGEKYAVTIARKSGDVTLFSETFDVTIAKRDLSDEAVTIAANPITAQTYNGKAQEPVPTGVRATINRVPTNLVEGTDYTLGYENNVNRTTAESRALVIIEATSSCQNYTGSGSIAFTINPFHLTDAVVDLPRQIASVEYTGSLQEPDLGAEVYDGLGRDANLIPAADYVFDYGTDFNTGVKSVTLIPAEENGNVDRELTVNNAYEITKASLKNADEPTVEEIVAGTADISSNWSEYFTVTVNGYTVKASDIKPNPTITGNTERAGESCSIKLEAVTEGNLKDSITIPFTTAPKKFADRYTSSSTFTYNGKEQVPNNTGLGVLTEKDGTDTISVNDYDVESDWANNINAGTATVSIVGKGNHIGQRSVAEFTISPYSVPTDYTATVTGIGRGSYYEGAEITGATVVLTKAGSPTINLKPEEYTLTAKTFANTAGQSRLKVVHIVLKGNYSGAFDANVDVVCDVANLANAVVTGEIPAGLTSYNDAAIKKYITVMINDTEVTAAAYNIEGITGTGALGTKVKFNIVPKPTVTQLIGEKNGCEIEVVQRDITDLTINPIASLEYDGTDKTPTVTLAVPENTKAVTEGTDFTVEYADNKNAGTATVTVTGKGNYKGTKTGSFTIRKHTVVDSDFDLVTPPASKRQFKVGAPDDLSPILTITAANGRTYVFDAADYTITQRKETPVRTRNSTYGPGSNYTYRKEVASSDRVSRNIYICYDVKINKDSVNYTENSTGFEKRYLLVAKTVDDAVVTLENDQLEVNNRTTFNRSDITALGIKVTVDGTLLSESDSNGYSVALMGSRKLPSQYGPSDKAPYVELTFHGNYTGIDSSTTFSIVNHIIDINQIKLIAPTTAESVYTGSRITATPSDIGDTPLPTSAYEIKYTQDGEEAQPINIGTYTATVWSTPDYGSVEGESVEFTITPQKINETKFNSLAVTAGAVEYKGEETEAPVLSGANASEFEVVSYDKEWDGKAEKGKAIVALKADSNYVFEGTRELEFTWRQGQLTGEPSDYYEIADQEYTGEELEPPLQVKPGKDVELSWAEVKYYESNIEVADKTAKAYVVVKAPADAKYAGELTGFVTFSIKYHEITPEEAREDAEEAGHIAALILSDPTYPDAAKAIVQEAIDALNEVLENPLATPDDIEDAVDDLYDAMDEAEELAEALEAADEALAEAAKVDDTYPADAKELVDEAKAALYEAIEGGDPEEIEDATSDLELAVAVADIAKAAKEAEEKAKEEALEEAGEAIVEAIAMALTGDYTDESMAAISDAAANLAEVAGKEDATAAEIKAATEKLQKAMDKAVAKQVTSIAVSDVKAVYSGEAPEVPTPIVLGSTGKVSYKFYADAEGKTELAAAPVDAGKYFYKATVDADANFKSAESQIAKFDIDKAASKISKIKPTSKNTKAGKKFTLKATVTAGDGKVTFKKTSGNKKIKVAKSGKVTVKKGLAKGTYKIKVKAKIAKTANYKAASKKATIKITVK